jgi:hypothetical protein
VFINNADTNHPVITAIGYVNWKYTYASAAPQSYFAAVNVSGPQLPSQSSRKVNIQTKFDPMFAVGMAAISTIDMNGNGVTTDSFNSMDPAHSISGLYPFGNISMVSSNGDIATLASIVNGANIGNANINGKAKTGPGGSVYVGANGYVSGGISDDFNVQFPNVTVPFSPATALPLGGNITVDGKNYAASIMNSGDYIINGGNWTKSIYIATNAQVRIYIANNVNLSGSSDEIHISTGATVKMYMAAPTFSVKGNGIVNENGNANSFSYYGLPSNTTVDFGGNGGFTGTIYAPQANFTLGGGGGNTYDFIGASVTKTVKLNGHFNFHYDEALRIKGPGRGYIPTDWREG